MLVYKGNVLDKDLVSPPPAPAQGDVYIVGSEATGEWEGHDQEIATFSGSSWLFYRPRTDWKVWVEDESLFYLYTPDNLWVAKNSVADYIPLAQREKDFWVLTTTLIERKIADLDPEIRKIATKWDAIDEYDEESLRGIISEMGYGYISDMFELTNQQLRSLVNFLNLIHYLKGTRAGLELVFKLTGVISYEIKEWWELTYWDVCEIFGVLGSWDHLLSTPSSAGLWTPNVEPHTFVILNANVPNKQPDTEKKIRNFCRNYVYPMLVMLTFSS